jgi:membrane protease YdiL (CAAX protease family)
MVLFDRDLITILFGGIGVYVLEYILHLSLGGLGFFETLFDSGIVFQVLLFVLSVVSIWRFSLRVHIQRPSFTSLGMGAIGGISLSYVAFLLDSAFASVSTTIVSTISSTGGVFFLVSVFLAPIVEEIFYRGVVYGQLRRSISIGPALILSSALFSLSHIHIFLQGGGVAYTVEAAVTLFVSGVVFGWLYMKYQSIFVAIAAHSVYNLIIL